MTDILSFTITKGCRYKVFIQSLKLNEVILKFSMYTCENGFVIPCPDLSTCVSALIWN